MKPLHIYIAAFFIAAALLAAPQPAPAQGMAGAITDVAMQIAINESLQDALSPTDKMDPARFKLSSKVVDDAKVLHPLIIKQLDNIAGSNEYWTGAQYILYIAKSKDKFNPVKVTPANDKKPAVTLVVFVEDQIALLDVPPQLTRGFPGNVQAAIINRIILPNFSKGHVQRGIIDGTRAILMAMQGAYTRPDPALVAKPAPYNWTPLIVLGLLAAGSLGRSSSRRPHDRYYDTRPPGGGARGNW
jgi:hypothetical protein